MLGYLDCGFGDFGFGMFEMLDWNCDFGFIILDVVLFKLFVVCWIWDAGFGVFG